jgi:transcriptional regulator with XRE-family HTH domain
VTQEAPSYGTLIARNLLAARARARLKQADVAARMRALGFSWHPQTVGEVENGRRRVTAEEILGLAAVLETSVGRIMSPLDEDHYLRLPCGQTIRGATVRDPIGFARDNSITWQDNVPRFGTLTIPWEDDSR